MNPRRDLRASVPVAIFGLALCLAAPARADWRTDGGYWTLGAELGGALPTGAGIIVLQTEGGGGVPLTPTASPTFPGTGGYAGKWFTMDSGGMVYSDHANSVAAFFYSNTASVSPGVTDVHLMDADDFIFALSDPDSPPVAAGSVHNHSWVGNFSGDVSLAIPYLRAFDFQVDRDGIVACTPLGNGAAMPHLMANCYHSISVGLRSGSHSIGGSTTDGVGRMKPDLVVAESLTSLASPAVASAAAMLRGAIKAGHPLADRPEAIKAILLAGASKANLPGWKRAGAGTPYDSVRGAGELNIHDAWHILNRGRQAAGEASEVSASGWDCDTAQSVGVKRYFFSVPAGSCGNIFSATLTWHRTIGYFHDPGSPPLVPASASYSSSLANLNLRLHAAEGLVAGALLDQSSSAVDNVEHLFQRNLPPGQYALEVSSNTDGVEYALAWQVQIGAGPLVAVRVEGGAVHLDLANLDPFTTYTIQKSAGLAGWSNAATVRTADTLPSTTHTWQDPAAPAPTSAFYRLQWTAIR